MLRFFTIRFILQSFITRFYKLAVVEHNTQRSVLCVLYVNLRLLLEKSLF